MFESRDVGVVYTEHSSIKAATPIVSLWSFETRSRGRDVRRVALKPDGSQEYWLEQSDPLLNTILPGTHVSLIVNFGDLWAAGRSLATSALLPRVCVLGPFTQTRILRVGRSVRAVGAVIPPTLTRAVFDVAAAELVDRIVPLEELWLRDEVETICAALSCLDIPPCLTALKDMLVQRMGRPLSRETVGQTAPALITLHGGRVSIEHMAKSHRLSRQQFARRFCAATGLLPKMYARITRFQALVNTLLSTDVARWVSVPPALGFYDQAHMINEFRGFAGSPPTLFFQPHGGNIEPTEIQLRGRPSEWLLRRPHR